MNYLEAKSELTSRAPRIPFKMIAVEAVAMIATAGLLVQIFS